MARHPGGWCGVNLAITAPDSCLGGQEVLAAEVCALAPPEIAVAKVIACLEGSRSHWSMRPARDLTAHVSGWDPLRYQRSAYDQQVEPSIDPEAETRWVYALYGATMHAIQGLEMAVAWLYLVANTESTTGRSGSSRRQLRRTLERSWRAFQHGTAPMKLNDVQRGVRNHLEPELGDELDAFLKGPRAQLAHRFLVERLRVIDEREARFRPGTVAVLVEVTRQATQLMRKIMDRAEEIRSSWPDVPPAPEELRETLTEIARMTMLKEFRLPKK